MPELFTGVQVVEDGTPKQVDTLFEKGSLLVSDVNLVQPPYPNSFVVLKSLNKQSAVCRISRDGKKLLLIKDPRASGLKPRNKEQTMLLSTLLDDSIPVQIVTGKAGTGKTLLALAAAMHKVEEGTYDKIIMTKPMSQVGKYELGILPGTVQEKFLPFLMNYATNIEVLLGSAAEHAKEEKRKGAKRGNGNGMVTTDSYSSAMSNLMADFLTTYNVEIVPIQVFRGASFQKAVIIVDEIQVLGTHEILTIGTRVAEGSKLILMGDLNQRDENIAKKATGLWKAIHTEKMKQSGLVSYIDLIKVERGPVAELFASVFEDPDDK